MPDETTGFEPDKTLFPELPRPDAVVETLCESEWVSLKIVRKPGAGVGGYVFSHETRCQGRIVAVLPYRNHDGRREYLVKSEMTPCWGFDQFRSAITGGYEGGDIEDDAVRELLEETGYAVTRDDLVPLGESFASQSSDTVYSLFTADLTGREAGDAIGDGTRVEAESAAVWVAFGELMWMRDPQLHVMFMRLFGQPGILADPAIVNLARTAELEIQEADPEPALPAGEYARVQILGHDHHTGWVTESTRAGQPVMVVRNWEGFVIAEVPGHSLYRFVPLPTPQKRPDPEQRRALPSGWGDDDDDYAELPADSSPF